MSVELTSHLRSVARELRHEPTPKRVRAYSGGELVLDSRRARLVWEPRHVVALYAVPADDLAGSAASDRPVEPAPDGHGPVFPNVPFAAHTATGRPLDLLAGGTTLAGAGFALDDLDGYVLVDWDAPDEWREEDDVVVGHPRDPFHRVDVRQGSDEVVVTHDGVELARSTRPRLVFETQFPTQHYLPAADVRTDLLTSTDTSTTCAYKGVASYLAHDGLADVAWGYAHPFPDAADLADTWCFDGSKVDVTVTPA
ncbi:DUF427 domain-containing protein [Solicola sp. PLA-1-18]|uniref:DUF427 domain-containing protein n=1 Tax=Solicola sp. PLA-1-18 TaxID=3380532 RepID=UPI003B827D6B